PALASALSTDSCAATACTNLGRRHLAAQETLSSRGAVRWGLPAAAWRRAYTRRFPRDPGVYSDPTDASHTVRGAGIWTDQRDRSGQRCGACGRIRTGRRHMVAGALPSPADA